MNLSCGLTTHSYDYIHYGDHTDAYNAMLGNNNDEIIRKRKKKTDDQVKKLNKKINSIFSGAVGEKTAFFGTDKQGGKVQRQIITVEDYKNFILGESGTAGIENLAVQLLNRPGNLNTMLKEIDNLKSTSGLGNLQALRRFLGYFGGQIELTKTNGNDINVSLIPDTKFTTKNIQPLSISKLDEILNSISPAEIELKAISEQHEQLKGLGGEISAGLLAAVALGAQNEAFLKIENQGFKPLRQTSKFKVKIDSKKMQSLIAEKQQELNQISTALTKANVKTKMVDIRSTFDKQGKVDVTVGDLNISAKNYWSDNPFELGDMNVAGLMNLITAYYPGYGWNTPNYHVFINALAANDPISGKVMNLVETYFKMFKSILIGYDIDVLFLVRYGIPKFYNAFDAYINDDLFKLYGTKHFDNKWENNETGSNNLEEAVSRSQRVWYNIMKSRFVVKQTHINI